MHQIGNTFTLGYSWKIEIKFNGWLLLKRLQTDLYKKSNKIIQIKI